MKGLLEKNSLTHQLPFEKQPEKILMADNVQLMYPQKKFSPNILQKGRKLKYEYDFLVRLT